MFYLRGAVNTAGRSPHGERGLKYRSEVQQCAAQVALLMESVD